MSGIAIITEARIDLKERACVNVCTLQGIYDYRSRTLLFSEAEAGSGLADPSSAPHVLTANLHVDGTAVTTLPGSRQEAP